MLVIDDDPTVTPEGSRPEGSRTVGARIRRRRRELGLTQAELARRLQLSQPTLSAYEKGTTQIPAYHLERIADLLRVEQRYLREDAPEERAALPEFMMAIQGEGLTIRLSIHVDRNIDETRMAQILKHLRRLLNETTPPST